MNDYQRKRISIHEAGHAIVAHHDGFRSEGVKVHVKGGSAASNPRLPGAPIAQYASSRLRVLLAGAIAQCLVLEPENANCVVRACACDDANDDWRKAEEIITLLAQHRTDGLVDDDARMHAIQDGLLKEHIKQTQAIIEANREVLDQAARLLMAKFHELFSHSPSDFDAPTEVFLSASGLQPLLDLVNFVGDDGAPI